MRQGPHTKRGRGRGGNRRTGTPNRNHTFDSNGPDVRIRGNAHQVHEKYMNLARDASTSGDRVLAESYFQHAEHYYRILSAFTDESNSDPNRNRHNGAGQGYNGNGAAPSAEDDAQPGGEQDRAAATAEPVTVIEAKETATVDPIASAAPVEEPTVEPVQDQSEPVVPDSPAPQRAKQSETGANKPTLSLRRRRNGADRSADSPANSDGEVSPGVTVTVVGSPEAEPEAAPAAPPRPRRRPRVAAAKTENSAPGDE